VLEPTARSLRPLLTVLRPHLRLLAGALTCAISAQALLVTIGGLTAYIVGRAFLGAGAAALRPLLVLLVILVVSQTLLAWAESWVAHVAAFRALADLRRRCYDAFERLSPAHLVSRRSGDVGATIMDDVELLELFFAHTLSPLVAATVVPVAAVAALAVLAWPAALVLAPFVVAVAVVPAVLRRRAVREGTQEREGLGELNATLVDAVQGAREIVALGATEQQLTALRRRSQLLERVQVAHARRSGAERAAVDLLAGLGVLCVLTTVAVLVGRGQLGAALLPTCAVLAAGAFAPVAVLSNAVRELGRVSAGSVRVQALLTADAPVVDLVEHPPPGPISPTITFQNVCFRYAPDLPEALSGVTFQVAAGETVALVGASGAGKSTCAALLLRMHDVTAGRVLIGGVDVRDLPQRVLRENVGLVPQDVYLFSSTLHHNLLLGRPEANEAALQAAVSTARVSEFAERLPEQYATRLGERGVLLSGGQRQRVAVARALLRDTPVLVLDEATSSLDTEHETAVQAALAAATRGRTTLVIAHRLSTIRAADRLIVLAQGRVVETGTFTDLLAQDSHFAALIRAGLDTAQ